MQNPFNFGTPVPPQKFVGRWGQIEVIANDLTNVGGHSHAVIGGRRFGKSSFLEILQYELVKQQDQIKSGDWYIFPVLINLKRLGKYSPEGVFGLVLNTIYKNLHSQHIKKILGIPFSIDLQKTSLYSFVQSKQSECTLDNFSEITEDLLDIFNNSYGLLRLVLLIDEIEVILDKDRTEILFGQLRSLIYDGFLRNYLRCVIAGSSQVIDVREQGSPLLNMLKITYLEALEEKDIMKIIHWSHDVPSKVARAVLVQSGGHPFLVQYLMYHLWEIGISTTTTRSVIRLANIFIHENYSDFEQWLIDIGKAGQLVYRLLAEANDWLTETQIRQQVHVPDLNVGRGLITLCYHGLTLQDGTWSRYHFAGELFKGWFQDNVLPSLDASRIPTTSSDNPLKDSLTIDRQLDANNSASTSKSSRTIAIISYSHKDKRYLNELHIHLAPYVRTESISFWDDTMTPYGSKWREEIEKALQCAKAAVLLVSADFLASDFIANSELPSLLAAAELEGAIILPVILRPCAFKDTDIAQFQAINALSNPLSKMTPGKRDEIWSKVAVLVQKALAKDR